MQIKPIFKNKNTLPIVFAFNNDYCKYFAVALKSLIENSNKQLFYDIIIFTSDISERNKKLLKEMLPENFSLRFYNVSKYITKLLNNIELITLNYWSVEMYYRIVIPLIMRDYKKVLYADSDIIFNNNIDEIFNIDFENKQLLAISDSFNLISTLEEVQTRNIYNEKVLKLNKEDTYFNSGILMFNIQAIESENYKEKIKEAFTNITETYCPDQDILNYIFKKNIKLIDQKWNMQYHIPIYHQNDYTHLDKKLLNEYQIAYQNPTIIHYTSGIKPWFKPQENLAEFFWKYARKTDYYEEILLAMQNKKIVESIFTTNLYIKLQTGKKVLLWGASTFLEEFLKNYNISKEYYSNIVGIIDKDELRVQLFKSDFKMLLPQEIKNYKADEIIITIINQQNKCFQEIKKILEEQKIEIKLSKL